MSSIKLLSPSLEYADEIMSFKNDFIMSNDTMDGTGRLRKCNNAEEFIELSKIFENPATVPAGYASANQYIAVNENNRIVGMIDVRHHINTPTLREVGGHIGYCVRPSERNKGYAKKMLEQALAIAKELGINKVLITCLRNNIASEKVITSLGGVFERYAYDGNLELKRFWINQ